MSIFRALSLSSCDGPTGEELRARFLFLRGTGVPTGCEPRQYSCSSGESAASVACLDVSSVLPTRSDNGSLAAGVDGGGKDLLCGRRGVSNASSTSFTFDVFGVSWGFDVVCRRFSFSGSSASVSSSWKALSFVRVWVDGMMGGPVTTCRAGGASLCWWGGALRGRVHWPLKRYQTL